ncbi:MAG: hypothetical protein HYT27_02850 [Parcubacteria group bacterium]|nr:hypothetical protein [Parcubacteria group bacterium]
MRDMLRFGTLAVLLLCVGIVGNPAYAEQGKEPSCTQEKSAEDAGYSIHYKKYQSDMFDSSGKGKAPISTQTINSLGERGLKLTSVDVLADAYVYWFLCKEQVDYQVLNPTKDQNILGRLNQLARSLGWELVATVSAHEERWYYLAKPKQPAR